jgi:hypothetical protein
VGNVCHATRRRACLLSSWESNRFRASSELVELDRVSPDLTIISVGTKRALEDRARAYIQTADRTLVVCVFAPSADCHHMINLADRDLGHGDTAIHLGYPHRSGGDS